MAGEWIKVEAATMDKPEILRAARKLGADRDLVLGKMVRLWSWFDVNSVDGRVDGVTSTDVDALVTMPGFSCVMRDVGWLHFDDGAEVVWLPNFERHNGETAKKRALKNKRQTRWRQKRDEVVDVAVDVEASTGASTREEKRREENINPPISPPPGGTRTERGSRLPNDWSLPNEWRQWVLTNTHGVDADREAHKFLDFWRAKAGAGAKKKDWFATWRNWCRSAEERHGKKRPESDWMKEAM